MGEGGAGGLDAINPKWYLGLTILFTYVLLIMGNIVTTTGSGLDCPDWPLCHGTVNPPKRIGVWIEWSHRLLGGVTGILIIVSSVFMIKRASGAMKFLMGIALALIFVVILLGGIVVLTEAPLLNSFVRIVTVSSHIVVSTVIFSSMILAFRAVAGPGAAGGKNYSLSFFGIVYFQVILGVVVRYSGASLACPDFPLCLGSVLPTLSDSGALLHYFHRLTALGILTLACWHFLKCRKGGDGSAFHSGVTLGLVLAQATIGSAIVLTKMFLPFLVLHGAVGFMLLGWTAYLAGPFIVPVARREAAA